MYNGRCVYTIDSWRVSFIFIGSPQRLSVVFLDSQEPFRFSRKHTSDIYTYILTLFRWEEWGNPSEEKYFDYMLSYSPMNNVPTDATYPSLLVLGGLCKFMIAALLILCICSSSANRILVRKSPIAYRRRSTCAVLGTC